MGRIALRQRIATLKPAVVISVLTATLLVLGTKPGFAAARETVKITFMFSSVAQRTMLNRLFDKFEQEHPQIKLEVMQEEQEKYKNNIAKWLAAPTPRSDVLYWFGGTKLRGFVEKGWVEPIDDIWNAGGYNGKFTKAARLSVAHDGKVYALPFSYYHWGFYYRKSLFQRLKLTPPQTWDEFLAVGEKLKAAGIVPVTLGSKDRWPAAAWFDYLNLRINGLAFHMKLMEGKAAYTDPKVKEVFRLWRELRDRGFFLAAHQRYDWRGSLPFLYRDKAGMLLMGNFLIPQLPEGMKDDIGFFRFPKIMPKQPFYEDAPVDVVLIPRNAGNKAGAKLLIEFLGRADTQQTWNNEMGMISPNRMAGIGDDPFIRAGAEMLADADGIAQFYDRDSPEALFTPGMEAFVRFLEDPDSLETSLQELEAVRKRVIKR